MRFAERFLVAFALIGILMRLFGMKDGPTLELIAMPLLALFYVIAMPFLLHVVRRGNWGQIIVGILCGLAMAYCIVSMMLYTLGWQVRRMDMLENCSILLGSLTIAGIVGLRRGAFYSGLVLRAAILLGIILIVSLLPLPHIGSLSRGAF
jgi:hypothetical protein